MPRAPRLDDVLTLAQAADSLGLAHATLARQARPGRLRAQKVGPVWVVTRAEVERYAGASKGRPGRRSIGEA